MKDGAGRVTRGRRAALVIVVVAVVLYAVVVALYALNDRSRDIGCQGAPSSDAVEVQLQPEAVDAAADRIAVNFAIRSFGPLEDPSSGLAREAVTIFVSDSDGAPTHRIEASQIPSPVSVRLITDGYIERWPFDTHTAQFAIVALRGDDGALSSVPLTLCGTPNVPGWTFTSETIAGNDDIVVDGAPVDMVELTAHRSGATVAFGLVILLLMIVMPVLTLTVAIFAYRGRRRVEATLMSWMAAMVFATIPLRGFLPGSPPIGSWVDYLVVLWVLAGLVIGLVVYVLAWLHWSPRATPSPAGDGAAALAVAVAATTTHPFPADGDAGPADADAGDGGAGDGGAGDGGL